MLANTVNSSVKSISNCYEDAVNALNDLQSNSAFIKAAKRHDRLSSTSIQDTIEYLSRSGITLKQLDDLSIIHVAGTKGKGSTCAFVESILREHGCRTGFYSSPHLISIRERFKINGTSISEAQFNHYFWKVYNILDKHKEHQNDKPKYFQFLTIMMFYMFLEANLDVAIIEVGIGGEFDCTNVIRNPVCTGITSLGIDHEVLLGNTLPDIAYQKSGIFKQNCPAFTVPQPKEAMEVLEKRAYEKGCDLTVVPPLTEYIWSTEVPKLSIESDVQAQNVSLAIQLSNCWASRTNFQTKLVPTCKSPNFCLSIDKVSKAVSTCKWPGRTQILNGKMADFYLDGAHTVESLSNCAKWYEQNVRDSRGKRYMIFNVTNNRDSVKLLTVMKNIKFNSVYFVPNIAGCAKVGDQKNINHSLNEQMLNCKINRDIWGENAVIAESVGEAFAMIASCELKGEEKPSVLITGSLHLVGAALLILDPDFTLKTDL